MISKKIADRCSIFLKVASLGLILLATSFLSTAWAANSRPLKVALLPILDSFPFYVAESKGFFKKNQVNTKAIPVMSGLERDQLMQSGEIDGMLNEMMSSAGFNRDQVTVQIVSAARKAYPNYPLFRILAGPKSGIDTPGKLAGKSVGISKNTIIEYVTDRLLQAEGVALDTVDKKSVPAIPERFQLLMQGQLTSANLPDPLAKSAMTAGALLVVDDSQYPQYSMSVLTFSVKALNAHGKDVRSFLRAWDQAAAEINADPQQYRGLLLEKIRVPKNIQDSYQIPPYPRKEVPNAAQWEDVMQWMADKGLMPKPVAYETTVTRAYLPE